MALENGTYVNSLVASNPASTDGIAQADDHIRLIKSTIKNTFPNVTGAVTATQAQLNATLPAGDVSYLAALNATGVTSTQYGHLSGVTSNIQTQLNTATSGNVPASDVTYLASLSATSTSSTQYGYLSGVSSSIQTQLNSATGATTALDGRVTTLEGAGSGGGDITGVTAGAGLTGGGSTGAVTVSHSDTSSQATVSNSGTTVIQSVTLDTYGHVTGLTSATIASNTPSTTLGAVGTYAMLYDTSAAQLTAGNTRAGSVLRYSNALSDVNEITWHGAAPTGTVAAPSGMWRLMGTLGYANLLATNYAYIKGSQTSIWVRIS